MKTGSRWGQWLVISDHPVEEGKVTSTVPSSHVMGKKSALGRILWLGTRLIRSQERDQITELKPIQIDRRISLFLGQGILLPGLIVLCSLCSCSLLCALFSKWGTVLFSALTIAFGKQSYNQCMTLSCISTITGSLSGVLWQIQIADVLTACWRWQKQLFCQDPAYLRQWNFWLGYKVAPKPKCQKNLGKE